MRMHMQKKHSDGKEKGKNLEISTELAHVDGLLADKRVCGSVLVKEQVVSVEQADVFRVAAFQADHGIVALRFLLTGISLVHLPVSVQKRYRTRARALA